LGVGVSTSLRASTSGDPYLSYTTAFIQSLDDSGNLRRWAPRTDENADQLRAPMPAPARAHTSGPASPIGALPLLEGAGTFQAAAVFSRGRECPRHPVPQPPRRSLPLFECTSSAQDPWVSS
jgi:hypothetical protein